MRETWETIKDWRSRAAELRAAVDDFCVPSAQDALIEAAEIFERMAADLERRLNDQGIKPKDFA